MADKLFKDYFNERQEDNAIQGNTKILIKRGNNVRKIDVDKFATAAQGQLADTAVQPAQLDNYVDLTSNQTIGGDKTFSGDTRYGDITAGLRFRRSGSTFNIEAANTLFSSWNNIHLKADGLNGLFIQKDTNNVGIGTTNPTAKLQVNGSFAINYNAGNSNFIEQKNGTIGFGRITPFNNQGDFVFDTNFLFDGGYKFRYNGSDKLVINHDGNVGIGTTSPTAKLDVDGTAFLRDRVASDYITPYSGNELLMLNGVNNHLTIQGNTKITGTLDLNDGSDRTIMGTQAGGSGASQTAIGYRAGLDTTDINQTFVGYEAGRGASGSSLTAFGLFAGRLSTSSLSVFVGRESGLLSSADNVCGVGFRAGYSSSGGNSVAVGYEAGRDNTGGNQTAVGYQAGYLNTGANQTAIGIEAGSQNTGSQNIAIGRISSLQNSGDNVISIGISATRSNSGNNILALGNNAAQNNTQSNRTIIDNDLLPAFASFSLAEAAFGTGQAGMTYLYFNTITNAIEGVRF